MASSLTPNGTLRRPGPGCAPAPGRALRRPDRPIDHRRRFFGRSPSSTLCTGLSNSWTSRGVGACALAHGYFAATGAGSTRNRPDRPSSSSALARDRCLPPRSRRAGALRRRGPDPARPRSASGSSATTAGARTMGIDVAELFFDDGPQIEDLVPVVPADPAGATALVVNVCDRGRRALRHPRRRGLPVAEDLRAPPVGAPRQRTRSPPSSCPAARFAVLTAANNDGRREVPLRPPRQRGVSLRPAGGLAPADKALAPANPDALAVGPDGRAWPSSTRPSGSDSSLREGPGLDLTPSASAPVASSSPPGRRSPPTAIPPATPKPAASAPSSRRPAPGSASSRSPPTDPPSPAPCGPASAGPPTACAWRPSRSPTASTPPAAVARSRPPSSSTSPASPPPPASASPPAPSCASRSPAPLVPG